MFRNSSVMICGPTQIHSFPALCLIIQLRGCVKKNFTLWWGRRIFKLRTVLDPASVDVKTYLVYIKMEYSLNSSVQSQNYLGLGLGVPYKAERTHSTTHWSGPEYSFCCNGWRRQLRFKDWSVSSKQTPQGLSEAGFFYAGKSLC